jgi:hypothetical protein
MKKVSHMKKLGPTTSVKRTIPITNKKANDKSDEKDIEQNIPEEYKEEEQV